MATERERMGAMLAAVEAGGILNIYVNNNPVDVMTIDRTDEEEKCTPVHHALADLLRADIRDVIEEEEETQLVLHALNFWLSMEETIPASDNGLTAAKMKKLVKRYSSRNNG